MISEEQIEKMFEKWFQDKYDLSMQFRDWQTCDYLHLNKLQFQDGFQAATKLLVPITKRLYDGLDCAIDAMADECRQDEDCDHCSFVAILKQVQEEIAKMGGRR